MAVRKWIAALGAGSESGRRYDVESEEVGGRHIGRNRLPVRVTVSRPEQAWRLLRVQRDVERFDQIMEFCTTVPAVHEWALRHPHRALDLHDEFPALVATFRWLGEQRGSGRYLREISAPGVDTKFAERHRSVLAATLEVPSTPAGFLSGLGLRAKPDLVRIRVSPSLGFPRAITELALRATELAQLPIAPRSVIVVENEITYLSVDIPHGGIVIWGKGFEVDRVGRLPWLAQVPVVYWGDIDTHGFAILDRLLAWLPETRSVLMDRETLLHHRERWGREDKPARSDLRHLKGRERDLYDDLVTDRLGSRVRLEQERVDWTWARERLQQVVDEVTLRAARPSPPTARAPGGSRTR